MNIVKDFDYYLEATVYGYCRSKSEPLFAAIDVPNDIIQLVLFWYHPSTISLHCIIASRRNEKTFAVFINPKDTVDDLKQTISSHEVGSTVNKPFLIIIPPGKALKDGLQIHQYNIHHGAFLTIKSK